jgi:pimeloyl-ACP methyl ester carboxylesterase
MGENLPIIYVRGFGGGQSGIDKAADDPFYGFNEGSTHIRVGAKGKPKFYQYEGPMLRLMLEQGYKLRVGGSQQLGLINAKPDELDPASVWIYRFYDANAGTFGEDPEPYEIGKAAKGLADFIALVREKTKGSPRVNLVAHSMGGLICRTALQRVIDKPETVVSKLCTIGTPHGGIDPKLGGGVGDWIMKNLGPNGSDIFAPEVMRTYMLPDDHDWKKDVRKGSKDWDPRIMVGSFPPQRVLSIVGTNARDYEVAHGLSSLAVGEQSDGLVAIANAYVKTSPRAYVHRAHSGRYGLVNSEEAYQNLKRFLFGTLRVEIAFEELDPTVMKDDRIWQADARLSIRELPVLIHEQTADHFCPVDLNAEAKEISTPFSPVPLITMFLTPNKEKKTCRYALSLGVNSLKQKSGWFGLTDHLEQIADWDDSLIIDLIIDEKGDVTGGSYGWNSKISGLIENQLEMPNPLDWKSTGEGAEKVWNGAVNLPESVATMLGPFAKLTFAVNRWD